MVFLGETDPGHPRRIPIKQVASGDQSSIFLLEMIHFGMKVMICFVMLLFSTVFDEKEVNRKITY